MDPNQQIAFNIFLVTFLGFFLSFSQSHTFYVGGKNGWVLKPKEDYNNWAERNRFLINDTLIFRYKKGYDTVLEVEKDDYYKCNKEKPLQALKDGESFFKFNSPGPFFFISGHADNCGKGQRLIIIVFHPRGSTNKAPSSFVTSSPSPAATIISPILVPNPSPVKANSAPPAAAKISPTVPPTSPPSPVIIHHLAPAPAPSAASISGGSIGSSLGISFLVIAAFGYAF